MKISPRSKFHRGGYAALLTTISLSLTIIAFAITGFRETRQSHRVQIRNQVKLDYSQKEQAFLRSLLHIVPNTAMKAMMTDSAPKSNELDWASIFNQAMVQASIDQGLDPSNYSTLSISASALSANTGDADFDPQNFVVSPNGSGLFVLADNDSTRSDTAGNPLDLPTRMNFYNSGGASSNSHPIVNLNKKLSSDSPLYTELPYPNIAFGYAEQGSTFIAKRNWWAFTVNFGAETASITGIAPNPRTYVLSIYEVPTQLAMSSAGAKTSLGKFSGGSSWNANINIEGSIFARSAQVEDTGNVGVVASREGVHLGSSAPSGQTIGGLTERRELRATTGAFHRFSSSSDSGLVSFTPINSGADFFDYFAGTSAAERTSNFYGGSTATSTNHSDYFSAVYDPNSVNKTSWDEYSIGARQTQMQVEVGATQTGSQEPSRLYISARFNNDSRTRRQRTSTGNTSSFWWRAPGQSSVTGGGQSWPRSPAGDDWFIQPGELPNGRPCLELDLEKLPNFLSQITADDVTINNSIWIGPNYGFSGVDKASYPSIPSDTALLIYKSADLTAFTNGLTIVTPYRVYFGDNFNDVPLVPAPAGAVTDASGNWYPPVSVYAPEKRFGIQNTSGDIEIAGQVGYLPSDTETTTINPLDLKDGGTDTVSPSSISAELKSISRVEDLPPVNAMNWLTTIVEIHN